MNLMMLAAAWQQQTPELPGSDALAAALAFYLLLGLVLGGLCVYLFRRRSRTRGRKKGSGQEDSSREA